MSEATRPSNIKSSSFRPSGYELPGYVCFDCGKVTRSVLQVYGPTRDIVMVHRNGTGCHKGMTAVEVRDIAR